MSWRGHFGRSNYVQQKRASSASPAHWRAKAPKTASLPTPSLPVSSRPPTAATAGPPRLQCNVWAVMTDELAVQLASIESALRRLDRQVLLRSLRHGSTGDAVRGTLGAAGLAAAVDLETLFGWHDGTLTDGVVLDDVHIFPGFYFLSLEDASANYRAFVSDSRWVTGWWPVFANGGGDFYVLDLSAAEAKPVRHFRIDEAEHPIEFSSLAAMAATLARAFADGTFFVDSSGYLEMDDQVFGQLAAKLNPDVLWWHD